MKYLLTPIQPSPRRQFEGETYAEVPCIRCGTMLDNRMARVGMQPSEGLAFQSTGHYGSAFFDPLDGSVLEIAVCDKCLADYVGEEVEDQA